MLNFEFKPAVIGLGYVGLPLIVKISELYQAVGFDINEERLSELKNGIDSTGELNDEETKLLENIKLSSNKDDLSDCNFYIVTVPTPVRSGNLPDFSFLEEASRMLGSILKVNDIVVYESTVFPGATETICVPILEETSKLTFNKDFFVGYSPERINPGDKKHRLDNIIKVTSGSDTKSAELINTFYASIISAGTHCASSIRVAEAAKVIENVQRDVNIALVNELSRIFHVLNLDTNEVLDAACSKWNFLNFRPGLVGGHCIGIDPYYLLYKANLHGLHPELIAAARRINDAMVEKVVHDFIANCMQNNIISQSKRVLILGATFKENCPDVRNSKVFDFINEFLKFGIEVVIYDPVAVFDFESAKFANNFTDKIEKSDYLGIILAVPHDEFIALGADKIKSYAPPGAVFVDLKGAFHISQSSLRM